MQAKASAEQVVLPKHRVRTKRGSRSSLHKLTSAEMQTDQNVMRAPSCICRIEVPYSRLVISPPLLQSIHVFPGLL
jgi:hypothetical protein